MEEKRAGGWGEEEERGLFSGQVGEGQARNGRSRAGGSSSQRRTEEDGSGCDRGASSPKQNSHSLKPKRKKTGGTADRASDGHDGVVGVAGACASHGVQTQWTPPDRAGEGEGRGERTHHQTGRRGNDSADVGVCYHTHGADALISTRDAGVVQFGRGQCHKKLKARLRKHPNFRAFRSAQPVLMLLWVGVRACRGGDVLPAGELRPRWGGRRGRVRRAAPLLVGELWSCLWGRSVAAERWRPGEGAAQLVEGARGLVGDSWRNGGVHSRRRRLSSMMAFLSHLPSSLRPRWQATSLHIKRMNEHDTCSNHALTDKRPPRSPLLVIARPPPASTAPRPQRPHRPDPAAVPPHPAAALRHQQPPNPQS